MTSKVDTHTTAFNRNRVLPSVVAQKIRRSKGYAWDIETQTFRLSAEVPEQKITSTVSQFHREKLYARDDDGCCWFSPPFKRDQRNYRHGGGNYFTSACVETKKFSMGDFVSFRDTEVNEYSRRQNHHNTQNNQVFTSEAIGQITCMWEGFPRSAKFSRWVEVQRYRVLESRDLIATGDFEYLTLQSLIEHVNVKFRHLSIETNSSRCSTNKRAANSEYFSKQSRLEKSALKAISPQLNKRDTLLAQDNVEEYLPWDIVYKYDVQVSNQYFFPDQNSN